MVGVYQTGPRALGVALSFHLDRLQRPTYCLRGVEIRITQAQGATLSSRVIWLKSGLGHDQRLLRFPSSRVLLGLHMGQARVALERLREGQTGGLTFTLVDWRSYRLFLYCKLMDSFWFFQTFECVECFQKLPPVYIDAVWMLYIWMIYICICIYKCISIY